MATLHTVWQRLIRGLFCLMFVVLTPLAAGPATAAVDQPAAGPLPAGRALPAASGPRAPAVTFVAQPGQAYIHMSTIDNLSGDLTYLENPALNGNPNIKFLATSQLQAEDSAIARTDHPMGAYYDGSNSHWSIYNDDVMTMTAPLAWNVFIPPQDGNLIIHVSAAGNISGSQTFIDNAQFNFAPDATIFVEHLFNNFVAAGSAPDILSGGYYTRTIAVAYDTGRQQWSIMNADGSSFPEGKHFIVWKAGPDKTAFKHISSDANDLTFASTYIDNPAANGNPDAQILVTQNFGTGVTNRANNHRLGVWYNDVLKRWAIFNQDFAAMNPGIMYNVLVIPPKRGFFLQTATAGNTTLNLTAIDNPDLNNNPYALIYVAHNWNPPESPNDVYDDHPIGVKYISGSWYVMNVDGAPMPLGVTFNVFYTWPRGNSFSTSASTSNTSSSYMTINNPLLNLNPDAIAVSTFNANPAGLPGGVYTYPVGLRYYGPLSAWQIFNSGPTFEITQTYNVLVPPVSSSFVVTATNASIGGNSLFIDNPLTNGDPWAMVFATERDNSGLQNAQNIGVFYAGGQWAIFNEHTAIDMPLDAVFDVFVINRRYLYLSLVMK